MGSERHRKTLGDWVHGKGETEKYGKKNKSKSALKNRFFA